MADTVRWKRAVGSSLDLSNAKKLGACCAQVATTRGAVVVTRTDRARNPAHATALAREAALWERAAALDESVLPLLDCGAIPAGGLCLIAPAGDRMGQTEEKGALKTARTLAAAVARLGAVHGNLSVETVFLKAGTPVVGGFGGTRLQKVEQGADERDDVYALGTILYFLLSGKEYAGGKLRLDKSAVSTQTRRLLRRVFDKSTDFSLLELRYDIGAALGDLPAATRALPPSDANRRKETMLKADLNSVNGSNSRREAELQAATPTPAPTVPVRRKASADAPAKVSQTRRIAAPIAPTIPLSSLSPAPTAPSTPLQGSVDDVVSSLLEPHLERMDASKLQSLIHHVNKQPSAVGDVFKILFKRPISKNPVVAFKGLTMLHALLREGPPEVTAAAYSHDEFFSWVQSSWSRERIQSRPAHKAHRLSHCFAVGELGWYAGFLRQRASFFSKYTAIFSNRWTVRPGALQFATENQRALRTALSVLEGAGGVLKKAAAASDPAQMVKKGAILPLTADVAYAYRACCWLYATAPLALKSKMEDELDVAHHATCSVFRVIAANPAVAGTLPVSILLQLDETPPRNVDVNGAISAMKSLSIAPVKNGGEKKKKKKSKRRSNSPDVEGKAGSEEDEESQDGSDGSEDSHQSPNENEPESHGREKNRKKKNGDGKGRKVKPMGNGAATLNGNGATLLDDELENGKEVDESSSRSLRREKSRKNKSKKSRRRNGSASSDSDADDGGSDSDDSDSSGKGRRSSGSKKGRAQRSEKDIPFDKEPPRRKSSAKPKPARKPDVVSGAVPDNRQGSKEAIAAAASGQKTPQMNPTFEVAPYAVQFGPQIGSGGFGVVHKAKFNGHTVAVKKIHGHALSNVASIAEFKSEVAVLCTLKHPNILAFMGACTKPPNLMIITEFMSRGTLFDVLHQSQLRITWPMRRKFALDTCRGMRYLHDSKLLHRDLKSSNLMLGADFTCKVGDFGLTRTSSGTAAVQMTGQCGTFQYMAVEVLANKPYSEKADVFSFGILLWEMVARKLPYFGMQPMQVGMAVVQQGLRPTIPPKTPAPLSKLMQSCWATDPGRRPSFAQLVDVLEKMPE